MMPPADTPTHLSIKMWMKTGLPSDSVASQSTDGGGWLPMGEFAHRWEAAGGCRLTELRCCFGKLNWLLKLGREGVFASFIGKPHWGEALTTS
jgi:hypothetical protein